MPRAGSLRQMLRVLTVDDLQEIKKEFCPRVQDYQSQDCKTDFVKSLRNSLKRSIDQGDLTYEKLMSFIVETVSEDKPKRVTTRIRHILKDITISKNAGRDTASGERERWTCSEIYQGLHYELEDTPYQVETEKYLGSSKAHAYADVYISHSTEKRNYIVEVKLIGNQSRRALLNQLMNYRKYGSYIKKIFVVLIAEETHHLPRNFQPINTLIDKLEDKNDVEVITKPPISLKYA